MCKIASKEPLFRTSEMFQTSSDHITQRSQLLVDLQLLSPGRDFLLSNKLRFCQQGKALCFLCDVTDHPHQMCHAETRDYEHFVIPHVVFSWFYEFFI